LAKCHNSDGEGEAMRTATAQRKHSCLGSALDACDGLHGHAPAPGWLGKLEHNRNPPFTLNLLARPQSCLQAKGHKEDVQTFVSSRCTDSTILQRNRFSSTVCGRSSNASSSSGLPLLRAPSHVRRGVKRRLRASRIPAAARSACAVPCPCVTCA
jgi:hypothetical protein